MKTSRIHIGLVFAGLLSLAIAGCTLRIPDNNVPDVPLTFDPIMYAPVKATSGEYPVDKDFCATVWSYPAADGIQAAKSYLSAARVSRMNGSWAPVPAALWPGKGNRILVLAASPYGAETDVNLESGVIFSGIDTADQTDLLYTDRISGLTHDDSNGVVNLPFRHALCLLDFEMRCNGATDQQATLLSVSIDQLYTRGAFTSLPEPTWTTEGEAQEAVFFVGEQNISYNNQPVGNSRWTIPQLLSSQVSITICYHETPDTEETALTLKSAPFNLLLEPGRHYTLTLSCLLDTKALKIDILDDLL